MEGADRERVVSVGMALPVKVLPERNLEAPRFQKREIWAWKTWKVYVSFACLWEDCQCMV
jgi:hypothetical protein